MCTVSMVGDWYRDKIYGPGTAPQWPQVIPFPNHVPPPVSDAPTRAEFDALVKSVEEMKQLLLAAKEYDRSHNQPDCEMEDKVAVLKKLAAMVGISLDDVFKLEIK